MIFKRLLKTYSLFALLTFVYVAGLKAQTHAEATSQKWKGIDVTTVIGTNNYTDDNDYHHGYPFLLYNVGTGCFVTQGGDWAMEGRLFFRTFGRTMYLYNNGRINSGLTEAGISIAKNSFCCRPPEPFSKDWGNNNYSTINLTTLMDGAVQSGKYDQLWHFVQVPGETGDTCTYYMYQSSTKRYNIYAGKNFYLGAAWGECHNSDPAVNGKGDGRFVFLDDDRCCWTTENVIGNTEKKKLENGDEIEIQKLYQWKLISVEEFLRVLNGDGAGLNPSISALIPDRDFTRNSDDFYQLEGMPMDGYSQWTVSPLRGYTYEEGTTRYTYTWGDYKKGDPNGLWYNNQQSIEGRIVNEPWDSPVKLKAVFDRRISQNEDSQKEGKKNAKNGFLPFEGVGTISTNFQVTQPGWYELECAGFSMSKYNHDAYMFARVISNDDVNILECEFEIPSGDVPHYGSVILEKLDFDSYSKDSYRNCLKVGNELRTNGDAHRQKVWVLVSEEDFSRGNCTIRVGFGKNAATRNETAINGGFYDTDWVCVDDIRASYMGLSPVFFYEDQEDLNYLSHDTDPDVRARYLANEYAPANWNGRYAGAACLQRKFTTGEWNTFSFPLPLTGEQVRNAFGDKSELLILDGIGTISDNDCIIDFKTVNLLTTQKVIEAGNLYMLKPSKEPAFGENPRGQMADYYDLGKMFFSTKAADVDDPDYNYPFMNLSTCKGEQGVGSFQGKNPGCGHVTYIQTPNFNTFHVDKDGIKPTSVDSPEGSYAPKGSYAMSGGKMYELSRDTRIKGFRGWITLTHSIFKDAESSAAGACIAIDGVIDGDATTAIDRHTPVPVNLNAITAVYDLSGRKVGESIDNLPKGIYIVGGKKMLVK